MFCAHTYAYSAKPAQTRPFQPNTSRRVDSERSSQQWSSCKRGDTSRHHIFGQISDRLVKENGQHGQRYTSEMQPNKERMFTVEEIKESQVSGSIAQGGSREGGEGGENYECREEI